MKRFQPLVSCLMVTKPVNARFKLIQKSIQSFLWQTYQKKELIMVLDQSSVIEKQRLVRYVQRLNHPNIRMIHSDRNVTLGELRNLSVRHARGEAICQWDDDDLSHPKRIAVQLKHLSHTRAGAVYLRNVLHVFTEQQICFWTDWNKMKCKALPSTLFMKKCDFLPYRKVNKREDLYLMAQLSTWTKVAVLDAPPFLYLYHFHGNNTWSLNHHMAIAEKSAVSMKKIRSDKSRLIRGIREAGLKLNQMRISDRQDSLFFKQ
jgi:glycosyltransferase involved in cell wall biosynthesis